MNRSILAFGSAAVLMAAVACLQPSIYPLITPENSTFDPALVGQWRCGREVWTITEQQEDDRRPYSVKIAERGQTVEMVAWLGRIGDKTFIDFVLMTFLTGNLRS